MKSSSGGGDVSGGCYLQLSSRRLEKPLVDFEKKTRKHPLNESKRHNRSLRVREMNDNLGIMGLLRVKRRRRKKFVYRKIRRKLTTMAALKVKTCWNLMVQRGEFSPFRVFFNFNFFILLNLLDVIVRFISMHVTIYD